MTRRAPRLVAVAFVLALAAPVHGGTLYVANNGLDGVDCGSKAAACRSISRALALAAVGDKIVVGPGRYGDLDGDGTLGEPGEETPSQGCGCVLSFNKAVTLISSDGAAATVIDGRGASTSTNVLMVSEGGELGKPGKGFTVTNTKLNGGHGIRIDSNGVALRGNLVVGSDGGGQLNTGDGISTVNSPGTVLIEGNLVLGWDGSGIRLLGSGKTVRKNRLSTNSIGVQAAGVATISGNVATANGIGFMVQDQITVGGNAALGNAEGVRFFAAAFTGVFAKNNLVGNGCGILNAGTSNLVAANNFWGAATGPGPAPADPICDSSPYTTSAAPFATKPFNVKVKITP